MSASTGRISDEAYVELDGIPFPLVKGSMMQRSPLNPFSPATGSGNTARITDARLAVEVWDDFSGGMGLRSEDGQQDSHSYSVGNLDTRVPGRVVLPPGETLTAVTAFAPTDVGVQVEYMRGGPVEPSLFLWLFNSNVSQVVRNGVIVSRPGTDKVRGFAAHAGGYTYIAQVGLDMKVYTTLDAGNTFAATTVVASEWSALTSLDGLLITYDVANDAFLQSVDGVTWVAHSPGFLPRYGERVAQLLVWDAPGGTEDTVYAITTQRVLAYEATSTTWHTFWDFDGIYINDQTRSAVWRRDRNLYFAPYGSDNTAAVMQFTSGTADEVGPTKRYYPLDIDGFFRLEGGAHWLYGWAKAGTAGVPGSACTKGGLYSFNEFQGWSQLFDPVNTSLSANAVVTGGGYANGYAYVLCSDGRLYKLHVPDRRKLPPDSLETYNAGAVNFIASAETTHNQVNRWKTGAFVEVDMRLASGASGLPSTASYDFYYSLNGGAFVHLGPFNNAAVTSWPHKLLLPDNVTQAGAPYRRLQWQITLTRGATPASSPALASVAWYYSYWQENHSAYQFAIDLSHETWAEFYPDGYFGPYSRGELQLALLSLNDVKTYHTLKLYSGEFEETIGAVDVLVAGREDADSGGGVYSCTARDLDAN